MEKILDKVNHLLEIFSEWEPRMIERVRTEVAAQLGTESQRWKGDVSQLEKKVMACEELMDGCRMETHSKIAECEMKIDELLERTKHMDGTNTVAGSTNRGDLDEESWPYLSGSRQCNIVDKEHVKEIIAKVVSQQQEEDKDLEKRQHNIIIYRVPEKRSDIFAERKEHDTEFVKDLMDSVFSYKLEDSEIDRMYRLG